MAIHTSMAQVAPVGGILRVSRQSRLMALAQLSPRTVPANVTMLTATVPTPRRAPSCYLPAPPSTSRKISNLLHSSPPRSLSPTPFTSPCLLPQVYKTLSTGGHPHPQFQPQPRFLSVSSIRHSLSTRTLLHQCQSRHLSSTTTSTSASGSSRTGINTSTTHRTVGTFPLSLNTNRSSIGEMNMKTSPSSPAINGGIPTPPPEPTSTTPTLTTPSGNPIATFAFAFDIDGVLLHGATPIPGASECLRYLHDREIPFILLTNGGGKTEMERIKILSTKLNVPLTLDNFVQSHTPFQTLDHLKEKTVLITGGDPHKCRQIAEGYGFKNVVISGDLHVHHRKIWPFDGPLDGVYDSESAKYRSLPKPIHHPTNPSLSDTEGAPTGSKTPPGENLKIDAILCFNDPRDWALDIQVITDLLLSHAGFLGTYSPRNGDANLPNNGWQQDGQPELYFSHQDLFWSTGYHLPRLAQGAFQGALAGVWDLITDGHPLQRTTIGKPHAETYEYAERVIHHYRKLVLGEKGDATNVLQRVWMVGDNPASDIKGANEFAAQGGVEWPSMLVRTGVWHPERGGRPKYEPSAGIFDNVKGAVGFALGYESARMEGEGKEGWRNFWITEQ